jgi:hypothetical protein
MMMNKLIFGIVGAAIMAPAALSAGGSSLGTYGGRGATVQGQIESQTTTGALPFTGMDVSLLIAVGLLVVGVGFMIRRLGRDRA